MPEGEPSHAEMIAAVKRIIAESRGATFNSLSEDDRDGLRAVLAHLERMRWKPIETAPKDGTEVLIGWFGLPGQKAMQVAFWHSTQDAWCNAYQLFSKDPNWQPTHWMPLPPSPETPR